MTKQAMQHSSINKDLIKKVAREYSTLDYFSKLATLLSSIYPEEVFSNYPKQILHKKINDVLLYNYKGEYELKYILSKLFFNKNLIAAFEMRVNKSRADFLTVNGVSKSFEIKSGLDNLSKLQKQSSDYSLVFDYNYIVIDYKHYKKAVELIPEKFGIWCFSNGKRQIQRNAILNTSIDPEMQLKLLTKKELNNYFSEEDGQIEQILKFKSSDEINYQFKNILKERYRNRWEFLVKHQNDILPIDIQFFFNTNISPEFIYNI